MKKHIYAFLFLLPLGSLAQCMLSVYPSSPTVCQGSNVTLTAVGANATYMSTTIAGGNNHRGNMFDLYATNDVIINSFDASPMGNTTIEVYYRTSPYAGFESNSSGWTLLGAAPVSYSGSFVAVPVPVNVTIPAGQTYAFYVTSTQQGVSLNYTNGSAEGNTFVSDANLTFREGVGLEYPFTSGTGAVYRPRVWNGVIHYTPVAAAPSVTYLWSTTEVTSVISHTVNTATQYTVQADVTGCATMFATVDVNISVPTVYAGSDLTICPGVPATLSGSGTAVSYAWDNSVTDGVAFTPAATADYIVTGTDAFGCDATDTVTITLYSMPAVNAGADFSVCTGDSATLAASGASSYAWDNGVTDGVAFAPTSTMDYIVEGTDINSCINTDTITITVNNIPTVNAGGDLQVCDLASVTLAGSGATTYLWDNNVTDNVPFNAVAGTYIVRGIDSNGCSDTDTLIISTYSLPVVNAGSDFAVCAGAEAILTGSGAGPYSWDNGVSDGVAFTPAATMDYILSSDPDMNGCVGKDTVTVTVNIVDANVSVLDSTITAAASGAAYQWIDCGTNTPVSGANSQSFTPTLGGSYAVEVVENGCTDTSSCEAIVLVGIKQVTQANLFALYPNPSSGQITISTGALVADEIAVMDFSGRVLKQIKPVSAQTSADLSAYAAGMYLVRVVAGDKMEMMKVRKD